MPCPYDGNGRSQRLPGLAKRDWPLQSRNRCVCGLFGAQGVHYVNSGGAGGWKHGGYYGGG
jgi:hypothetical protein